MAEEKMLGKNIRFYREAAGITQEELSKELGIGSRSTLASWESSYSSPDAELLPAIADALHISVDDLFMGTYKVANRVMGEKDTPTLVEEIKELLDKAGHISLETANRCRQAITDELKERAEQERRRQQIMSTDPIEFPLFISEYDEDYYEMKEKMRELRKLKRKNSYTYSDLRERMCLIDRQYDYHICLMYYFFMFSGEMVPSRQLYERMRGILSQPRKK